LDSTEQQKWNDFEKKVDIWKFISALKDLKNNRLDDCHPTTFLDGKEVNPDDMKSIIQNSYKPKKNVLKSIAMNFVVMLKEYHHLF
jgi:hypothetical protein